MRRYLTVLLLMLCALSVATPNADAARRSSKGSKRAAVSAASGVNDPRYADLIMNPVTGEVYHQVDPDAKRYPASLTKMMTLYLLFEALEKKTTSMDARLDVSNYAATMPQTNLALAPGDSIPVETAIKALVVRSANDVSVVVAEALGGDVEHFADMMTAKARALGMRNTVFQNPNGLPNSLQYTTARDMAKLGIALKRDFPQYYPYFNTRQFSWDGVTYYTHNRVMLRYPGTDGIKTGFTGAAGFNLVSSVTRGGRPLVGVVMGGGSGAWRDNRMIQLLDSSYQVIAERGATRGKIYAANLPLPKRGGTTGVGIGGVTAGAAEIAVAQQETSAPDNNESEEGAATEPAPVKQAVVPQRAPNVPAKPPVKAPAVAVITPPAPAPAPVTTTLPPGAIQATTANGTVIIVPKPNSNATAATPVVIATPIQTGAPIQLANPPLAKGAGGWGIQVGAFSTHELAEQAAKQATVIAPAALQGARASVMGPANGATVHRARLENLSEKQAKKACEALISNNSPCFIFKATPEAL